MFGTLLKTFFALRTMMCKLQTKTYFYWRKAKDYRLCIYLRIANALITELKAYSFNYVLINASNLL